MAKKFRDLRAKMSKESRARAHEKAQVMLSESPLAELRQARHFSQEQLAAELDVRQPAAAKIEKKNGHVYLDSAPIYRSNGGKTGNLCAFSRWRRED